MKKNYLLLLIAFALPVLSFALLSDYSFTSSAGTYNEITGGTVITSAATDDDQVFGNMPIGFSFKYNGSFYTNFGVALNGFVNLGTSAPTTVTSPISSSSGVNQVLSPFGTDLQGQTNCELSYLTTGEAPNRVCTIQWKGYKKYSSTYTSTLNFQVKLYETTNNIEYVYGTCTTNNTSTWSIQVGLRGTSNSDYMNRLTTSNWSATTAGTANNSTCKFSSTIFPASGLSFMFNAPVSYTNDMQTVVLRSPYSITQYIATNNVTVKIRNNGSSAQSNIPVYFKDVTDNIVLNTTVTGPLNSSDTLLVNFGTGYTPASYGTHTFEVWTALPTDENASNDRVTCTRVVLPAPADSFDEGFETISVGQLPAGWITAGTANKFNTYDNTTTANFRHPHNGIKFGAFQYNCNSYLISQPVNFTEGRSYIFKYYYSTDGLAGWTTVEGLYGTAQTSAAMTHVLTTISSPVNTDYVVSSTLFTAPTTGIYYFAIHIVGAVTPNFLCVDDISFSEASSNDLTVTGISFPNMDFFEGNDIAITSTIFNNGVEAITNKDVSFSVDGTPIGTSNVSSLASGTNINVVQHWNATVGSHTITVTVPDDENNTNNSLTKTLYVNRFGSLVEGFNDTVFPPYDWSIDSEWARNSYTYSEGTGSAYISPASVLSDAKLITPKLIISSGDVLSFYVKANYPAYTSLSIKYSSNKLDWTTLGSNIPLTNVFAQNTVDLTPFAGQNLYFAFCYSATSSRDPLYIDKVVGPVVYIPTTPEYAIYPSLTSTDFGTVIVGSSSSSQTFNVRNAGGSTLAVNSVSLVGENANQFLITNTSSLPFSMTHNQTMPISVQFIPTSAGNKTASLVITDALSRNTHSIQLTGNSIDYNYGGGDNNSTAGGYYYANSISANAPSKPIYSWIDPIANNHIEITNFVNQSNVANIDDGNFVISDMGFDFPFYGTSTRKLTVNTNGTIYVGDYPIATTPKNPYDTNNLATTIPNSTFSYSTIALACADMELDAAAAYTPAVYYSVSNNQCIITYYKAHDYNDEVEYITTQAILTPDGTIKMQYNYSESGFAATNDFINDFVIGIQNATGTKGLSYRSDATGGPLFDNSRTAGLAVQFGYDPMTLPVELTSFTATKVDNHISINWTTESENQITGYRIFRSMNNLYTDAVCITPEMIAANNTPVTHNYSVTDNNVATGNTYYYWIQVNEFNNTSTTHGPISIIMNAQGQTEAPTNTSLNRAYPNPFNPSVTIDYQIKETGLVNISIYNVKGQLVRTLVNTLLSPAYYSATWNGTNNSGIKASSGTYLYRMTTSDYSKTGKLLMLK